jgi:hypothetical protein
MSELYNSTTTYDSTTYEYDGALNQPIAGLPIVGVFFAPDNGPYDGNPDWIEITNYVRRVTINRGRSNDFEQFRTATATLTLDNRTRLFDPFNTSGTYYGKLVPRKQILIVAQANSTNYTIFRGYAAGFPVTWTENGYDSTVTVDCYDLLGLIAQTQLPIDWAYYITTGLNPVDYYRLDEPAGVLRYQNRGQNTAPLPLVTTYTASKQQSLAPGLAFESWDAQAYKSTVPAYTSVFSNFSCSWWVRNSQQYTATYGSSIANFSAGQYGFSMFGVFLPGLTPASSTIYININDYFNGWITFGTLPVQFYNDQPQHIVVVTTASGIPDVYVNGQPVTFTVTSQTASGAYGTTPQDSLSFSLGTFQEISVYDYALTASQVSSLYGAAAVGYVETTAARAQRIIDTTDIPADLVEITTAPVANVADFGTMGGYLLPALQTVADSEGGELFVDREGVLQFVNRWYSFGSLTSGYVQATFSEADLPYSDTFEIRYDSDSIRNKVKVSYTNNAQVEVSDSASIAAYGLNEQNINTLLSTVAEAEALATLETTVGSVLKPTTSPLSIGATRTTSEWATILGLDVLHRIVVTRTPPTGNAITQTMLINALSYDLTPDEWNVTVTGSARLTGWFTADVSLVGESDVVL